MKDTPIDYQIVKTKIEASGLSCIGKATIRRIVKLVNEIEKASGKRYIRMEMGVPGLPPSEIGTQAEIDALKRGVAAKYPMIEGIEELKQEVSRFIKLFINTDVSPQCCIPSVGSMQGSIASFLVACRREVKKDTTLFIDPGFPVHKQQHKVLGFKFVSFDVYDFRGEKLQQKLETYLSKGNISTMIYSNPNNPSWICFTDDELRIIGDMANKYDVVVIEDLAYVAMDFRTDMSLPGQPPYQPSVSQYTNNFILLISSSKVFSYAGQRVGCIVISDELFNRKFPNLKRFFTSDQFGHATIYGSLYSLSSGTSHSAQYALAAMLKAANDGTYKFLEPVREYGERAKVMKRLFTDNGFKIVYDKDIDRPIADGFFFTFSYPGFTGEQLLEELLYYGISAIALTITGSTRLEGLRACVSRIRKDDYNELEHRLKKFHEHHPVA
ncbi:MAG: pyridoxal phosphate-dependent aminotransferase [Bacteroidia bacterium]|nr:pyridoxal phosphate-dependent aminotransferase [Bacteroidia bacterium]